MTMFFARRLRHLNNQLNCELGVIFRELRLGAALLVGLFALATANAIGWNIAAAEARFWQQSLELSQRSERGEADACNASPRSETNPKSSRARLLGGVSP